MSFEAYLKHWLGNSLPINENETGEKETSEFEEIKNLVDGGIGGETSDSSARSVSFESIEQVLQRLDVSLLEKIKNNPELQRILLEMVSPGKIEWLSEYLARSKKNLSSITSDKKKIDPSANFKRFTTLTVREADIKARIYKMYMIFKYAAEMPALDKETDTLLAIKKGGHKLKSSTEEGAEEYSIGKIGLIDNVMKSDEFEVIVEGGEKKILKKEELKDLLEKNPEIAEMIKGQIGESHKKKILKLSQRTEDAIKKEVANSFEQDAKVISELPNDEKTIEKLEVDWKPLIDALGYSKFYANEIKNKEAVIKKDEKPSLRKKNRIKEKLMTALRHSLLPPIANGEITEPGGDYFKLFKSIESKNAAWTDAAIREVLRDPVRIAEFNTGARKKESSLEENQLAYLHISSAWIIKYVESEVDGELSKRDTDNAIAKVKSITQEKEKEIKNYYLSKDFNMKNFRGIQLKPDLKLPLYQKVRLAVSEADRIAESPLKNLLKGLGQIAVGLFSTIPDRGDMAVAKKNAEQNRAVFNGIFSIVKGGTFAVSKQAGRDFEKGVKSVTNKARLDAVGLTPYEKGEGPQFYKSAEKKANEDAMSAPVSPGTSMQTPGTLPDNNMDTFSLAGPGKKTSKKKKSLVKRISSFKDFLKKE